MVLLWVKPKVVTDLKPGKLKDLDGMIEAGKITPRRRRAKGITKKEVKNNFPFLFLFIYH